MKTSKPLADAASRRERLDQYAAQVQAIILARQDAATGLLPASTAITVHGDYTHAWVRDNVYSIFAAWALALAYRREDPPLAVPLQASVVRLMRGLLTAMMKQSHKVERFKHTQDPLDALHAKYSTQSGDPVVGDSDWGHLQIDATAIFLLALAQMSAAGLQIVQSASEVAFVQNLVYYLAKAYRTPDYGIWERGHKQNEGRAEVNASSVGMAKAALETITGADLLPGRSPTIHVLADDIAHARNTLEGLLPRESASKETDAALLSVVGFPAFAVDDAALAARTRAEIVSKLQGRYGCKRFLRDGHQTVLEDHSRLYYEPGELRLFEHIESEWPLFFTYLLLDAASRGDLKEAADYRARLEGLFQQRDGQRLLPELYLVPADRVDAERVLPHSQVREPNENVPLVWAQSLYLVGVLLQEGYITAAELSPLRPQIGSAVAREVEIGVAVLAEDDLVKARLVSQGLTAQTLLEVHPVQVHYAKDLEAAFCALGHDDTLGLSGRPPHRLGSLVTSQAVTLGSQPLVFLPSFFNRQGFYLALDNRLLVDEIHAEIATIRHHWKFDGLPVLSLLITAPMLDAGGAELLLTFLRRLQAGEADGVRVGQLAALLPAARECRIDWLDCLPCEISFTEDGAEDDAALVWEEAATRPLTAAKTAALARESDNQALRQQLSRSHNPYEQIEIVRLLWSRNEAGLATSFGGDLRQLTQSMYGRACRERRWSVVRCAAGLLAIHDETLEDAVAQIVARQKRVAVGRSYSAESVISQPLGNHEIINRLQAHGGDDPRSRVLIQEIVLLLGTLSKAEPELLAGTLTLRPWHLLLLITGWLAREHEVTQAEAFDHLMDLSPHAILGRLRDVLAREQEMTNNLVRLQSLHYIGSSDRLVLLSFPPISDPGHAQPDEGWAAWRETAGVISRVPADFHTRIWELLQHGPGLVIGDQLDARNRLDSELARADTTPGEASFALQVEDLLSRIQAPEYRQLTIEALLALSDICAANHELQVDGLLVMDVLIGTAVKLGWQEGRLGSDDAADAAYNEQLAAAWQAFYDSPPHRVANLIMAAVAHLLASSEPENR